jgi:hypothetical protein
MIFGIGSGMFFGHLPFRKQTILPILLYQSLPSIGSPKNRLAASAQRLSTGGSAVSQKT